MKQIPRNPSFTPSPQLRNDLNNNPNGVTYRLNQIWDRYEYIIKTQSLDLSVDEIQLLKSILSGAFIDPVLIDNLYSEIIDSDEYLADDKTAKSLADKFKSASYVQSLATIERIKK
ncbi:MAG: hypothetical protein [Bacteriophage sp.]|nr:MAG: hypothetical protein [Bacteriophage sp.]